MNRLFVQFYTLRDRGILTDKPITYCCNGFSRMWDITEPLWLEDNGVLSVEQKELFSKQDEIYVSLWYAYLVRYILSWADIYRRTKFIVGGPMASLLYMIKESLPANIEVSCEDLESFFDIELRPNMWRVELPNITDLQLYSYGISDSCYWGKCTFCYQETRGSKSNNEIDLDSIARSPAGTVCLAHPSLTNSQIKIFPELDFSNKKYMFYVRGDVETYDSFIKTLPKVPYPEKLIARIGIEFPSNRMYRIMKKGVTVQSQTKLINLLDEYGIRKVLFYIVGWQELVKDDMTEARKFFESLIDIENKRTLHSICKLCYQIPPRISDGQAFFYAYTNPDGEAKKLNNDYYNLVTSRKNTQINDKSMTNSEWSMRLL